jgi:hypothetical protein
VDLPNCSGTALKQLASPKDEPCYLPPCLARNTIIESAFDVGRRFRCTMRINRGELDPGAVIRPVMGEWHPHMNERLDEEKLAHGAPAATRSISWRP